MRGQIRLYCIVAFFVCAVRGDETCSVHQDLSCVDEAECRDLDPGASPAWICVCPIGSSGDGRKGPGHTGCIFEFTPCDGNGEGICHRNAICSNNTCVCQTGYQGDGKRKCDDIDECALDICDPFATCQNTPGSFVCTCKMEYAGNGRVCHRVCESDQHCNRFGKCEDEACVCKTGYEGNGYSQCEDINECERGLSDCGENADCVNEIGTFLCKCSNGYTGDGYECERLPRNCQDIRDATSRYLSSGMYLIDPDREGPIEAFMAQCKFRGPLGITIFETKTSNRKVVESEDTEVFDPADVPRIRAVVESSQFCYQFVLFYCKTRLNLLDGTTYWVDGVGNRHYTWSGSKTPGKCGCGVIGMCGTDDESRHCMCDGNNKYKYDRGKIIDMDSLPIAKFHFQQLDGASTLKVEDLYCTKEPYRVAPDCDTIGKDYWYYRGYEGINYIDPDGPAGPIVPYMVQCEEHPFGWITVIPHDERHPLTPNAPRDIRFDYIIPDHVTEKLIDISQYCTQEVTYECRNSMLLGSYTKLVTRSGDVLDYWAGGEGESGQCACGLTESCSRADVSCNCNIDDGELRVDLGQIRNKDHLPIGGVNIAQAGNGAYAKFALGPLKCGQHEFGIAASCEAYRGTGYIHSYTYLVDPDGPPNPARQVEVNQAAFYVTCEMIMNPPHAVTIIHHNLETTQYFTSSAFVRIFSYRRAVVEQVKEYIKRSSYCIQPIGYACKRAPLNGGAGKRGFWESGDGIRKYYFSGVSGDKCACGLLGDCDGGAEKCNCDLNDNVKRRDDGVLGNKDDLPVTRVEVPGVDGMAELDLGPIKCFETYPTCEDLGAKNSDKELDPGAYTVDPDGYGGVEAFPVFCDFPITEVPTLNDGGKFSETHPEELITECFNISYGAPDNPLSPEQVQALVDHSSYCEQRVAFTCKYFPIADRISFTTCGGETFNTWTGDPGQETCACGILGVCEGGPETECNCDIGDRPSRRDSGYINIKSRLPVCQVCVTAEPTSVGDVDFRIGVVSVYDLKCQPQFGSGTYVSCQDYTEKLRGAETSIQIIDPDGSGPLQPLPFFCVVPTYPPAGIMTVLPRDPEIDVPEGGIDYTVLYYVVVKEYIKPIIRNSQYCEQELYIECSGSATLDLTYYGFAGPGGNIETYWAGNSDPDAGGCEGGICKCGQEELPDRIDGGVITDQDALPITRIKLGPSGGRRIIRIGPLKCFDIKPDCKAYMDASKYIQTSGGDGDFAIDPDQAGGVPYFMAHCDFDAYPGTAITEIVLENEIKVTIRGSILPGNETVPVTYDRVTPEQVNSLARISNFCYQVLLDTKFNINKGIAYECTESIISNASYIELIDGQSAGFGTADDSDINGCACVITNTCPQGKLCHCDALGPMTRDYGIVTDRDRLPIRNIVLTGQDSPTAEATISVTGVRCADKPVYLPIDCEDAYKRGYKTGEVYIQPNRDVAPFFVYCDMDIVPGHGITIIGNKLSESPETVDFPDTIDVEYNGASIDQVVSLADVSLFCYQPIKYNCFASKLLSSKKFFWIGRDGSTRQYFFGAGDPNDENCNCGVDNLCGGADGKYWQTKRGCNCDANDEVWRLDAGVFHSNDLPVTVLSFLSSSQSSQGKIQLGELYCGHVEFDLNECEIGYNDCAPEATCYNTFGSYECRCPRGYRGWGLPQKDFYSSGRVCYDDNECKFNYCPYSSDCTNLPGSFSCQCHDGFEQVGPTTCIDIDECTLGQHNCDVNADCTNIPGSFFCRCKQGYRGTGLVGECEEVGYCTCFGDPHCISFDSHWLNFQGACAYVMARDNCQSGGTPTWQVITQNWRGRLPGSSAVSWVKSVRIEYNSGDGLHVLVLKQGLAIYMDGVKITSAYWDNGFVIRIIGSNVEVFLVNGVLINWNGKTEVEVYAPRRFKGDMCGLCGNYNNNADDDWVIGPGCPNEGQLTDNNNVFGESWTVPGSVNGDTSQVCSADCNHPPGEPSCDSFKKMVATGLCDTMLYPYGPFKNCIAKMSSVVVHQFYESCTFDLCHMDTDMALGLCSIAVAFVKICQTQYKVDLPFWRSSGFCPMKCGENMEYSICGKRDKHPICRNMLGTDNPFPDEECTEGCFCKEGYQVDGDRCVEPEDCGCIYNSKYMSIGETVVSDDCTFIINCTKETLIQSDLECGEDKVCRMDDGVRGCYCLPGYKDVDGECVVDKCYGNNCTVESVCVDGECVCHMGFTGECNYCHDDDECRMGIDNCHEKAFCLNTRGSYFCICEAGFLAVDGRCEDMDECALEQHACGRNTKCINTYGAYECVCCEGYQMQLDGNCTESSEITGDNTAKCCVCIGDRCEADGLVCGTDANTYPNIKELVLDACERDVQLEIDYMGECQGKCADVECPTFKECTLSPVTGQPTCACEPCSSIDMEPQIVCLNPIDKFENMCEFKQAMCLLDSESPPLTGQACDPPPGRGPVTPWTEWTPCSVTCGKGTRTRERSFTRNASARDRNRYIMEQNEDCYEDPCPDGPCAVNNCTGYGEECVAFNDGSTDCECPHCAQPATHDHVCGLLGTAIGTFLNKCKLQRAACIKNLPYDELNSGKCGEVPEKCSRWPNFQYVEEGTCFSQRKINFGACIGGCSQITGHCCEPKRVITVTVPLACEDGSSSSKNIDVIKSCECVSEEIP